MSRRKIAGRNHIFLPLGIETTLIENLLPLGLEYRVSKKNMIPFIFKLAASRQEFDRI